MKMAIYGYTDYTVPPIYNNIMFIWTLVDFVIDGSLGMICLFSQRSIYDSTSANRLVFFNILKPTRYFIELNIYLGIRFSDCLV